MKKIISVFLAAVMCILPLSVCVLAAEDDAPSDVCYVTFPESGAYTIEPCEGYSQYVEKGKDFKFKITPAKGYSLDMAMVYYYPTDIADTAQNDGYFQQQVVRNAQTAYYTIDIVDTNITISVDQVIKKDKANLFRSLMDFIHMIFKAIGRLLGMDVDVAE